VSPHGMFSYIAPWWCPAGRLSILSPAGTCWLHAAACDVFTSASALCCRGLFRSRVDPTQAQLHFMRRGRQQGASEAGVYSMGTWGSGGEGGAGRHAGDDGR
jgi:hypothetical protein